MVCLKCNGDGWIKTYRLIPAQVYGEPISLPFTKVCPVCAGSGKVAVKMDRRTRIERQAQD